MDQRTNIVIVSEHLIMSRVAMYRSLFGDLADTPGFLSKTFSLSNLNSGHSFILKMIAGDNPPDMIIMDEYAGQDLCATVEKSIKSFRRAGYRGKIIVIDTNDALDENKIEWKTAGADFADKPAEVVDYLKNSKFVNALIKDRNGIYEKISGSGIGGSHWIKLHFDFSDERFADITPRDANGLPTERGGHLRLPWDIFGNNYRPA